MFDRLQEMWRRWRERRAMDAAVESLRGKIIALGQEMASENNIPSSQTVSRETRRVNRTGKCLECGDPLKKRRTGRYPLYCASCRGERSRKQNRKAALRYRAKKARAA